jgi:hypothetical protein
VCRKDIELSEETEFNLRFHSTVKLDQIARSLILTGGSGEKCITLVELSSCFTLHINSCTYPVEIQKKLTLKITLLFVNAHTNFVHTGEQEC